MAESANDRAPAMRLLLSTAVQSAVHYISVRPKPLFWFMSDTETEPQIGRYRNRYRNHIAKGKFSY